MDNNTASFIFYVYVYLRLDVGTVYYVGKGKGNRRFNNHKYIPVPKDKDRIHVVAHNLTEHEAWLLEKKLIQLYGRKDLGEGILINRTDDGDGPAGRIPWNKGKIGVQVPWNKGKIGVQEAWNKGKTTPLKGKTYEDIYGLEKSEQLKELRRAQKQEFWEDKKSGIA